MKKVTSILLAIVMTACFVACGQKAPTWQEQYDLGVRYLSEGSYEEAIIAFTAAIEIDTKRAETYVGRGDAYLGQGSEDEYLTAAFTDFETALSLDDTNTDAYLGMAEVYIAQAQFEEAIEILRQGVGKTGNQHLMDRLAELESGDISDYWGRKLKETHYDGRGKLIYWYVYDYNDQGQCIEITSYAANGEINQQLKQTYDTQGHMVYGLTSWESGSGVMEGGTYTYNSAGNLETVVKDSGSSRIYTYDTNNREIRTDYYDESGHLTDYIIYEYGTDYAKENYFNADGVMCEYAVHFYNEEGQSIRYERHDDDGALTVYATAEFDTNKKLIAWNFYDAEGNLTSRDTYN